MNTLLFTCFIFTSLCVILSFFAIKRRCNDIGDGATIAGIISVILFILYFICFSINERRQYCLMIRDNERLYASDCLNATEQELYKEITKETK